MKSWRITLRTGTETGTQKVNNKFNKASSLGIIRHILTFYNDEKAYIVVDVVYGDTIIQMFQWMACIKYVVV